MLLMSQDALATRAESIRSDIARTQGLLVGVTIVSATPMFGPDGDARRVPESTGDWILEFANGTKVRVTASYDDSGVHFETA